MSFNPGNTPPKTHVVELHKPHKNMKKLSKIADLAIEVFIDTDSQIRSRRRIFTDYSVSPLNQVCVQIVGFDSDDITPIGFFSATT